jgi:predicted nucleotide-binding protein
MITRIFLGSSAERIPILEELEGYLSTVGKCQRWTGAFVPNASGLESLIHQTRLSDFSVLLAMKDDITIKRGEEFNVARDNMIFEFGLFLGAAGIRKAFLLAEEGIDLPSDLDGNNPAPIYN